MHRGSDIDLQHTSALHRPDMECNLPESAGNLPGSKEPQVYTGMVLPGTDLYLPDSGRLPRSLPPDEHQVLGTTVREWQVAG